MTYLVDTDVMIDFFRLREPAKNLIQSLSSTDHLALSVVTVAELRTGWSTEQATRLLPQVYDLCSIEPVTREIAEQAGAWRRQYMQQGTPLGTPDTIIAATAYLKGYCMITRNKKDYPMPELHLYRDVVI